MPDKYRKPTFDSSTFIARLGREICKGIKRDVVFDWVWQRAKDGVFKVHISAIALAEVYKTKQRSTITSGASLDEFLELINEPFVEVIEVDRETGLLAHALCRKYAADKLMPNDGLHLACALKAGCDVLLAWDGPLTGISHPDIRIEEPAIYDRKLFDVSEVATPEEISEYDQKRKPKASLPSPIAVSGGSIRPTQGQAGTKSTETKSAVQAKEEEMNLENGDTVKIKGSDNIGTIVEVREPNKYLIQWGTDAAKREYKNGDDIELVAKVKKTPIEPGFVPSRPLSE